ncbi:MAG: hypothetical protein ACE5HP_02980 [Gemmatimonadota bacterium]
MNEILKKQIWRKLESLPEEKVYQVLDYIEFLESEYGSDEGPDATSFQRFSELFQRKMRKGKLPASALRETMKVLGTTDRVLEAFREAGREFLAELEGGKPEPPLKEESDPPEEREVIIE